MSTIDQQLAVLRTRFAGRCQTLAHDLRDAISRDDAEAVARIAHGIAGTGGMFGFERLSELGRRLEEETARQGLVKDNCAELLVELDQIAGRQG